MHMTFKARLNHIINRSPKIRLYDDVLQTKQEMDSLKARAQAYASNNKQGKALFLLG